MTLELEVDQKETSQCKGKIYKAKVTHYIGSRGEAIYQEKFIPMKRMSCDGCAKCNWLEDDLNEFMSNNTFPIIEDRIKDEGLYYLDVTNISHDFESGIVDDWNLIFRKLEK